MTTPPRAFIPLAISTDGTLHPDTLRFIWYLADIIAQRSMPLEDAAFGRHFVPDDGPAAEVLARKCAATYQRLTMQLTLEALLSGARRMTPLRAKALLEPEDSSSSDFVESPEESSPEVSDSDGGNPSSGPDDGRGAGDSEASPSLTVTSGASGELDTTGVLAAGPSSPASSPASVGHTVHSEKLHNHTQNTSPKRTSTAGTQTRHRQPKREAAQTSSLRAACLRGFALGLAMPRLGASSAAATAPSSPRRAAATAETATAAAATSQLLQPQPQPQRSATPPPPAATAAAAAQPQHPRQQQQQPQQQQQQQQRQRQQQQQQQQQHQQQQRPQPRGPREQRQSGQSSQESEPAPPPRPTLSLTSASERQRQLAIHQFTAGDLHRAVRTLLSSGIYKAESFADLLAEAQEKFPDGASPAFGSASADHLTQQALAVLQVDLTDILDTTSLIQAIKRYSSFAGTDDQ
uniref:Uncharacterized protein n=2 Tax=Guillardia theta (strain CCMP2712) TaxID=905079 RepID=A0A0C3SHD1_GUITC